MRQYHYYYLFSLLLIILMMLTCPRQVLGFVTAPRFSAVGHRVIARESRNQLLFLTKQHHCSNNGHLFRSPNFYGCLKTTKALFLTTTNTADTTPSLQITTTATQSEQQQQGSENENENNENDNNTIVSPWHPSVNNLNDDTRKSRFRQHVNPLARRFQMPADLPENWPRCDFDDLTRPLFLDVGCGKGGFLLDMVEKMGQSQQKEDTDGNSGGRPQQQQQQQQHHYNYLGVEIRPLVSAYARERLNKKKQSLMTRKRLSFVGCNANVDLSRLLSLYQQETTRDDDDDDDDATSNGKSEIEVDQEEKGGGGGFDHVLEYVCIQYPDPHFKKHHQKRRVVTNDLVDTLAKFMPRHHDYHCGDDDDGSLGRGRSSNSSGGGGGGGGKVLLQSDVKEVFDQMRSTFRESEYFDDTIQDFDSFLPDNPLGVPTERETSVLEKGLPVYRTLFHRNNKKIT